MIKAKCNNGDLVFGFTRENITCMERGEAIVLNLKELGLEDRWVMICFGETENNLYGILAQHVSEGKVNLPDHVRKATGEL